MFYDHLFAKSRQRRKLEKEGLASPKQRIRREQTLGHAADKSRFLTALILLGLWLVSVLTLLAPCKDNDLRYYLVEGQMAPETVYAEYDYSYQDVAETVKKRERARDKEPSIYKIDNALCEDIFERAKELLDRVAARISGTAIPAAGDTERDEIAAVAAGLSDEVVKQLEIIVGDEAKRKTLMETLAEIAYQGIIQKNGRESKPGEEVAIRVIDRNGGTRKPKALAEVFDPSAAAERFATDIARDYSPDNRPMLKEALREIASRSLKPNLVYDREQTETNKQNAFDNSINEVYNRLFKGACVVKKNQIVTAEILERFNAYEKEKSRRDVLSNFWGNALFAAGVSLALLLVTGIYLRLIHPWFYRSNQSLGVFAASLALAMLASLAADFAYNALSPAWNLPIALESSVMPLALAPALLAVLLDVRVALYGGLLVAFIVGMRADSNLVVVFGMIVGWVTAFAARRANNYKKYYLLVVASLSLAVILTQTIMAWKIGLTFRSLPLIAAMGVINGVITGSVSLVALFMIETVFRVSTDMTLLTLSDYNHPLLKRLQLEAPGTYHHSLVVATLAEQAADAIGANPIRARVCSLFHDIGKLAKPEYFTENNLSGENYHDDLSPRMSSLVILNHVKEGVNLAIKYKLRNIIRDAIEQHHGTDLVYFFYRRAIEENRLSGQTVSEAEYRYPGPTPRSKEVTLVSLADACEAASRSLTKVSPSKIDALVWEIFRKRIREGQLNDADLTFRELALARESFVKTLTSMLHGRVRYPDEKDQHDESDLFQAAKERAQSGDKGVSDAVEKDSGPGRFETGA